MASGLTTSDEGREACRLERAANDVPRRANAAQARQEFLSLYFFE